MSAVDLSKAKAGDTVHFRCGGSAVVKKIGVGVPHTEPLESEHMYWLFWVDDNIDWVVYRADGTALGARRSMTQIDIVSITHV